jgi:hypothetical protein
MGLILFILALALTSVIGALSLVVSISHYFITLKWTSGLKIINSFFYRLALSVDQFANVICAVPFQKLLTKGLNAHEFGDEDDTLSYVIAMNRNTDSLTRLGRFTGIALDFFEKDHLSKSIEFKRSRDMEAYNRIIKNK